MPRPSRTLSLPPGSSQTPIPHPLEEVLRRVFQFPSVAASAVAAASLETTCRLKIESVERFSGDINRVREELDEAGADQEVFVVCQTEAEVRRLEEIFSTTRAARDGRLRFPVGTLQQGFRLVSERIVLLSSGELFRRVDLRRHGRGGGCRGRSTVFSSCARATWWSTSATALPATGA